MNIFPAIDLFAGIGGLTIAFKTVFPNAKVVVAVEKDAIAQYVYNQHFPDTPIWDDVTTYKPEEDFNYETGVVYGGFPCQDTSSAGKRAGLAGKRSGLWWEMLRIINESRPAFVVVENPEGLLHRGGVAVLESLAKGGYDAEWQTVSARLAFGAPHWRERVFIVAHSHHVASRLEKSTRGKEGLQRCWNQQIREEAQVVAHSTGTGSQRRSAESHSAYLSSKLLNEYTSTRREDEQRRSSGDDGIPAWLDGIASARWCEEWLPPAHPGRPKTCDTQDAKIRRWVERESVSKYGNSCCPGQVEPAFRRIKYLAECAGIQGRDSDESGDGSGDSVRREDSDSEGK